MQRFVGAAAIFVGWLSLGVGIKSALDVSLYLNLMPINGVQPPLTVYGISGWAVLWVFAGAALISAMPMILAIAAKDPRGALQPVAMAMAIVGIVLVPDQLGIAFGLPLVAGAACLWTGGELIHQATVAAAAGGTNPGVPASTLIMEPAGAGSLPTPFDSAARPEAAEARAPENPGQTSGSGRSRKKPAAQERFCPWCSTRVPPKAITCPNCHASLDETATEKVSIPGVTEVAPELQHYQQRAAAKKNTRTVLLEMLTEAPAPGPEETPAPSDAAALRPPSPELRAEMARLDAEIAARQIPAAASDDEILKDVD